MGGFDRISGRLPHFYTSWDPGSSVAEFIAAEGKRSDECEKELRAIMRAHWVDTAHREDLDRIGAIFSVKRRENEPDKEYRNRLKTAIISYKGGGTIRAIQMLVAIALKLPQDEPVKIVENPQVMMKRSWKTSAGREWDVNPRSVRASIPSITLSVETEKARVTNPTLTNLTTGESISFNGDLATGDVLDIRDGNATLNGKKCTDKLSAASVPWLPRKKTRWQYMESIGANAGTFDSGRFDQSVFVIDVITEVTFGWQAHAPAQFELHLPGDLMIKAGIRIDTMQDLVDSVKACGVKGVVKVI
ncbi:MAG: hypothetical protein WC379_11135 [Methanoregula sp.]|jgi:hypothetical protein